MITCNHVSRKFTEPSGELWAVRDISLTVEDGTFLSIVGRSGSGKSTLLKMLGGLLMPTEGEVRIGDKSIYEMSVRITDAIQSDLSFRISFWKNYIRFTRTWKSF